MVINIMHWVASGKKSWPELVTDTSFRLIIMVEKGDFGSVFDIQARLVRLVKKVVNFKEVIGIEVDLEVVIDIIIRIELMADTWVRPTGVVDKRVNFEAVFYLQVGLVQGIDIKVSPSQVVEIKVLIVIISVKFKAGIMLEQEVVIHIIYNEDFKG